MQGFSLIEVLISLMLLSSLVLLNLEEAGRVQQLMQKLITQMEIFEQEQS